MRIICVFILQIIDIKYLTISVFGGDRMDVKWEMCKNVKHSDVIWPESDDNISLAIQSGFLSHSNLHHYRLNMTKTQFLICDNRLNPDQLLIK